MEMTMAWWLLLTLGVLLVIAEMMVGGFVIVWFGAGAILAAGITFISPGLNLGIQLLLSVLFGAVLLYMFRERFTKGGPNEASRLKTFEAGEGKLVLNGGNEQDPQVFCNGTHWRIANPDAIPDDASDGQTLSVERFEGSRAFLVQPRVSQTE